MTQFDSRIHNLVGLVAVRVVGEYSLHLVFDDGYERTIDLADELWGEVFEPLRDRKLFAEVVVDPEDKHLLSNGASFDNEVLRYDLETASGGPLGRGAPARPARAVSHQDD